MTTAVPTGTDSRVRLDAPDPEFREKLRSLSFVGRPTTSKKIVDHTDTAVVETTVKDESQDVHVVMNDCIRPHWKKESADG